MIRAFGIGLVFMAGLAVGSTFRAEASAGSRMLVRRSDGGTPIDLFCGTADPVYGLVHAAQHRDDYDVCPRTMPIRVDAQGYVICSLDGGTP